MEKLYDLSEIREMSGNDESFLKEMIELFVTNNTREFSRVTGLRLEDWQS